jgi:hypothetical protein
MVQWRVLAPTLSRTIASVQCEICCRSKRDASRYPREPVEAPTRVARRSAILTPYLTPYLPALVGSERVQAAWRSADSCVKVGWPTGLEPVTFGATIRNSGADFVLKITEDRARVRSCVRRSWAWSPCRQESGAQTASVVRPRAGHPSLSRRGSPTRVPVDSRPTRPPAALSRLPRCPRSNAPAVASGPAAQGHARCARADRPA